VNASVQTVAADPLISPLSIDRPSDWESGRIPNRTANRPDAQNPGITQSILQENILKSIYFAPFACAAMLFAFTNAFSDDVGKMDMHDAAAVHPDFDKVDTHQHGYLTSDDVKNDDYVRKNFARCNVKHNGHMSREEYTNCHE
jgi:hypothetical protein